MAVSFKGAHFPQEIILTGVRWYVAYPLSTRHVEELMLERGVNVDHSTINRWVIKYSPQLEEAFHRRKRPVWVSWRMDETYIKIKGQWAVAQKSPCEGKRVIMGQEFPLKLGQRRQDASEEVPMRTPKQLYAHQRIIYQPALLTCPHCGDLLVMCNSLAWDKTVQTFDRVLSVASRPGHCPHVTCASSRMRLLSAQAQRLALPGSTYGYDVLVRMAWWRQESRATYHEMHTALASQVRISASHVGSLSQQVSLPLLALPRAPAPRPPGSHCPRAGRRDDRPRWPGAPRGRAAHVVHPCTHQRLHLPPWLAVSAGSDHVRRLAATAHAPGVADSGRAQRQTNGLGAGGGDRLPPSRSQVCQAH